jgi:hypothetical protein
MSAKPTNIHKISQSPKRKAPSVASDMNTAEILETPVRPDVLEKAIKIAGDDLSKWRANIDARCAQLAKLAPMLGKMAVMGFDCRVLAYFDLVSLPEYKVIADEKDTRKAMIRGLATISMEILPSNSIGFDPLRFAMELEPVSSDFDK